MSVTSERRIVDFAEDGVAAARAGQLTGAIDELIVRLGEEGLTAELTAHPWIKRPVAFDGGSSPGRGKGCAFAVPAAMVRTLGFWLNPRQVVNDPAEVVPPSSAAGRPGVER